jgi:PPOX class probable F420-dependent enzyme
VTQPGSVPAGTRPLDRFESQWAAVLTTFRRDGTPVDTPVNLVVEGDRAFFRTYRESGKFKRLRRDPRVRLAPSTFRGQPTGPPLEARTRLLQGAEDDHAARLIDRKHRIFQAVLVRLGHRLRSFRTCHFELRPNA